MCRKSRGNKKICKNVMEIGKMCEISLGWPGQPLSTYNTLCLLNEFKVLQNEQGGFRVKSVYIIINLKVSIKNINVKSARCLPNVSISVLSEHIGYICTHNISAFRMGNIFFYIFLFYGLPFFLVDFSAWHRLMLAYYISTYV